MSSKNISVTICTRIPRNAYMGGIAVIVNKYIEKACLFEKGNVNVSLFSWHDDKVEKIGNSKIRNLLYWLSFRKAALQYCKENRPDIFHIHTAREFMFMRDVMVGSLINKKYHIRCALTIHVGAMSTVFNRLPRIFHKYLIRLLNQHFSCVFFLSKTMMEEFIQAGLNEERCKVLYNFFDMPVVEKISEAKSVLNILYVGAIQREKGISELIDSINRIKRDYSVKLDVCGLVNDSSIIPAFEKFCEDNRDIVETHGYVTGEMKTSIFLQADVLVLPSYHEGLPLVILEALASGCAIVTTRVGAIPEILGSDNVVWSDVADSESLYQAIKRFCTDKELLLKIKQSNVELSKKFSCESHIMELCTDYHRITGK